jgi:ornithine decarboxylase
MSLQEQITADPLNWVMAHRPDDPVLFLSEAQLRRDAQRFQAGFPGEVTYAVKANPLPDVVGVLVRAGLRAFDVASVAEMALVRGQCPEARLHYHNPVRSVAEIAQARRYGVVSWSVDRMSELDKLGDIQGVEIAVRLKLPVAGAAYDFGGKFGADPALAQQLLQVVAQRGGVPSMTFHPGTQCHDPEAWARYITACAQIAGRAGLRLHRLNVGGGFAAQRGARCPDLEAVFQRIGAELHHGFGTDAPGLVCEPGRAMVAESGTLVLRVKGVGEGAVFLNDGLYGGLAEWRDMPAGGRVSVFDRAGQLRQGALQPWVVFGPTCDSLDQVPGPVPLPSDLAEGDYLLIRAMGAYSTAIATGFNGYGSAQIAWI